VRKYLIMNGAIFPIEQKPPVVTTYPIDLLNKRVIMDACI